MAITQEKASELMQQYIEYGKKIRKLEDEQHYIRELVRNFMKESGQNRINTNGNIAIVSSYTKTSIDEEKVKGIITPEQYISVLKRTEIQSLKIMSEQTYNNMKERFGGKKNGKEKEHHN